MTAQERWYSFDRVLMINAICDIIDAHDGKIINSDSENGKLSAMIKESGKPLMFRFSLKPHENECLMRIETGDKSTSIEKLSCESHHIEALFDFLDSVLKRIYTPIPS